MKPFHLKLIYIGSKSHEIMGLNPPLHILFASQCNHRTAFTVGQFLISQECFEILIVSLRFLNVGLTLGFVTESIAQNTLDFFTAISCSIYFFKQWKVAVERVVQ
jgi:hypothetical protein